MDNLAKTSKKQVHCYAAALGGCSDIQSYEHYISQSLFTNNQITIEGQKWLQGTAKEVNKKRLGLKMLCRAHNTALSPLDLFIGKFAQKVLDAFVKSTEREKLPRSSIWTKEILDFNGYPIEQWMIKAAVGAMFEDITHHWHLENADQLYPPVRILEALFGIRKLKYPMGLYMVMGVGETFKIEERAGVHLLHNINTKGLMGTLVNIRNLQFLIWLAEEENNDSFLSWGGSHFGPGKNEPIHHPKQLILNAKGKTSGIINLNWSGEPMLLA